jgi:ferredoxin
MKTPTVDLSLCTLCELCTDVSPSVFKLNTSGYIEVADLDEYPEDEVDSVIKNCPADCVSWETT